MTGVQKIALIVLLIEAGTISVVDHYRQVIPEPRREYVPYLGGNVTSITYSSPVTITSSDPDVVTTSSSSPVIVSMTGPISTQPWNMQVKAASSTLTNCPKVPISAVTAVCNSFSGGGDGGNPTGSCGSVVLSNAYQVIGSGRQGDGGLDTFTFNMSFRFTDAWKYPGAISSPCGVSVTYQFNWDI